MAGGTGERDSSDMKGSPMMDVKNLVRQAIKGLQKDQLEILPGFSKSSKARKSYSARSGIKGGQRPGGCHVGTNEILIGENRTRA